MLLPIMPYTAIYLLPPPADDYSAYTDERFVLAGIVLLLAFAFFFFNKKIKSVRKGQGLRAKLEKYFSITIVRFIVFEICALALCAAFYLSRNDLFTIAFVAQLVLCGLLWPTSSKVARDLKLRGDEREMVYYKKDSF